MRRRVQGLTEDNQLGLRRTGHEIGVHSERHLAKLSRSLEKVILLLDFENAFHRVDRALLLELVIALVPGAASFLWWLYGRESVLMTQRRIKLPALLVSCRVVHSHLLLSP